jgi:hypothetical protein
MIVTVVRLAESVVAATEADNAFDMSPARVSKDVVVVDVR